MPATAVGLFGLFLAATISHAVQANNLGYDYRAYDEAVRRFLAGGALYDTSVQSFGPSGLFFYPPPFVLLAYPLTLLPTTAAIWIVTAFLVLAFCVAVWILPVSRKVRWATLLLGGISWPLLFSIELGQVGPILLLMFAIGWRWMDRPRAFGTAVAFGVAIKIQPILLLGWAFATGRRQAIVAAAVVFAALAIAATIVVGPTSWMDEVGLIVRVSKPIDTFHSFTPGQLVLTAGFGETAAWATQIANWLACAAVVLYAWFRTRPDVSYLATVIATQLLSPVLWDHYTLMILLPVAWLLERRRWWILPLPLAVSLPAAAVLPSLIYPTVLWVSLVAVVAIGVALEPDRQVPWARHRRAEPQNA